MTTGAIKTIRIPLKAIILGFCFTSGSLLAQTLPLPRNLITFSSAQGEQLLLASKARQDYWPLSIQFVINTNVVSTSFYNTIN